MSEQLPGINNDEIMKDAEKLIKQDDDAGDSGFFTVKSAKQWIEEAKNKPIPSMLFGEFWFEGEVCILFADTNLGKSILAVQIGDSISRGEPITGFTMEAQQQKILYFDFELSEKQFEHRYSNNYEQHYDWPENFYRVEINSEALIPEKMTMEDYQNQSLEQAIIMTGAKIIIVDNITYLKNETERARDAAPLMKYLKTLKKKYGLSLLALAHTPKRDLSKPITRNDLQGSKMLMHLCDSSFAIGESTADKNIRYLKQIKSRNTCKSYDCENVCLFQIDKPWNFLKFEFLSFSTEREHLKAITETERTELEKNVADLLDADPAATAYSIAKKLCPDQNKFLSFNVKVTRIVNRLRNQNANNNSNKSNDDDTGVINNNSTNGNNDGNSNGNNDGNSNDNSDGNNTDDNTDNNCIAPF